MTFSIETHELIDRVLRTSPTRRRVAVFDFDNTCIRGDSGERMHAWLSEHLLWHRPSLLAALEPDDGLADVAALWDAQSSGAVDANERAALTAELIAVFPRRLARVGPAQTYGWATGLLAGLAPEALRAEARRMWQSEVRLTPGATQVQPRGGGAIELSVGLRPRPAVRSLIGALEAAGVEVWIVSATNVWTVEALGTILGVPRHRVIGNACRVVDGVITAEREGPVTWAGGKVEAIERRIGERPLIAFGDSRTDTEMMMHAESAVLIDRGSEELRQLAAREGWAITAAEQLDSLVSDD